MRNSLMITAAVVLMAGIAAGQTVTVTLDSPADGQTVAGGATINWTMKVEVSTGDNVGLAAIAADLVQDAGNPAFLNLPPADPNSLDANMQNFSRPAGISNPGEVYPTSGYTGVQRGDAGQQNLVQIGGAQNTFGQPGSSIGQNVNVIGGIGQSGPQVVAAGSFAVPTVDGTYTYRLTNVLANVLESVATPPDHSPVKPVATVDTTGGEITVTVGPAACRGDASCDGLIDFDDINPFVDAVVSGIYCDGTGDNADVNADGTVDFDDINPFVTLLTTNPLPINCP